MRDSVRTLARLRSHPHPLPRSRRTIGTSLALAGAFVLALALGLASPAVRAEDMLPPVRLNPSITLSAAQRERLQTIADQGIDALRRHVWRTRMIYGWRLADLI